MKVERINKTIRDDLDCFQAFFGDLVADSAFLDTLNNMFRPPFMGSRRLYSCKKNNDSSICTHNKSKKLNNKIVITYSSEPTAIINTFEEIYSLINKLINREFGIGDYSKYMKDFQNLADLFWEYSIRLGFDNIKLKISLKPYVADQIASKLQRFTLIFIYLRHLFKDLKASNYDISESDIEFVTKAIKSISARYSELFNGKTILQIYEYLKSSSEYEWFSILKDIFNDELSTYRGYDLLENYW